MDLAANALTTLETLKTDMNILVSDIDEFLIHAINAVSDMIEKVCNRKFYKQTVKEVYEGTDDVYLYLYNNPIVDVSEVKISGQVNTDWLVFPEDEASGAVYLEYGWTRRTVGKGLTYVSINDLRHIEVSYTGGYVLPKDDMNPDPRTLPYDLEFLVIRIIRDYIDVFGATGFSSQLSGASLQGFSISDVSWRFGGTASISSQQSLSRIVSSYADELMMSGYKRYQI